MAILVTGGKGFIGSRVIKKLVDRGEDVVCLELKSTPGRLGDLTEKIKMVEGDISVYGDVEKAIINHNIERIAHMVFFSAEERGVSERPEKGGDLYKQMMIMNTGTFHVFEAARLAGIKRIIYPSSIAYYGPQTFYGDRPVTEDDQALPASGYGMGKQLCEHLAREYNRLLKMEIITVRIPGVYGPGVRIGARGVNLIGTQGGIGQPVPFPYSSKQKILLTHVDDLAEIIVRALLLKEMKREVYLVGGNPITFGELGQIGKELIPDMQITYNENVPVLLATWNWDASRMKQDLGVVHRSLKEGYLDLINLSRKEAGLPPIEKK